MTHQDQWTGVEAAIAVLEDRCASIDRHYARFPHTPERSMADTAAAMRTLIAAARAGSVGTDDGEAGGSEPSPPRSISLSGEAVLRAEIDRLREAMNKMAARNRTLARKLRGKRQRLALSTSQPGRGR